jgi:hypothetical protein
VPNLVQLGAIVLCAHGGNAVSAAPESAVTAGGRPISVMGDPWIVTGCPGVTPSVTPCLRAQWVSGTTRVTSRGRPLVFESSQARCEPTGTGLQVVSVQDRVRAL